MPRHPRGGRPDGSKYAASRQRSTRPQPWWMVVLLIFAANYLLMRVFSPEPSSITIPYTLFKEQVEAGNVEDVTSQGDAIQGTFKKEVTYPPDEASPSARRPRRRSPSELKPRTAMRFETQLPAFADPGLETLLEEKGVVINGALDESAPSWLKLLFGFGPTLLLIAAFVWLNQRMLARRAAGSSASAAAAPSATARQSRRSPSTTSPASTTPRTSSSRSSTS